MTAQFPDLSAARVIALDTETCDPSITNNMGSGELRDGYLCGISLATEDGFSEYYPIAHAQGDNLSKEHVLTYLREQLNHPGLTIVGHNLKYDLGYLKAAGVETTAKFYDTQIAEGLLDENKGNHGYSLEATAQKYLNTGKNSDLLYNYLAANFGGKPTRKEQAKNIWRAPGDIVKAYAVSDAKLPLEIAKKQVPLLTEQDLSALIELENGLLPLMLAMRFRGMRIDIDKVEQLKTQYAADIEVLENEIYQIFGNKFNLASHIQLAEMFETLGVTGNRTPGGKLATDKKALALISHPAAQKLLELSKLRTLLTTFLNGYCTEQIIGGRLHGELHNMKSDIGGTVTGRFSCSNPNLQNIPKDGIIRSLFLPEEDEVWHSADMSQIEYRLLVHYATGESAKQARESYIINPDMDYHNYTKELITARTGKDISRSHVKNINFGLMYTMGKKALAANLGLPLHEAEKLFALYHSSLPYVQETQRKMAARANQRGYVHTLLNRRRRFELWEPARWEDRQPPLPHSEAVDKYPGLIRRAHTKDALNAVLQGGCADIMKTAMYAIWKSGICDILGAPLNTVHDELNFSVPDNSVAKEAYAEAVNIMQSCIPLKVPLLVSQESGNNWGDLI